MVMPIFSSCLISVARFEKCLGVPSCFVYLTALIFDPEMVARPTSSNLVTTACVRMSSRCQSRFMYYVEQV